MKDPIVQEGDPVLRQKAKAVAKKDIGTKKILDIISRMKKALHKEEYGVAIAAPQIGESLRIFLISGRAFASDEDQKGFGEYEQNVDEAHAASGQGEQQRHSDQTLPPAQDKVFINPELLRVSKKTKEMSEGCLSVRGKYGTVMRHEKAAVKALDEHGKAFTYQGSGLIGHIFQHECDHLDGILYTDKTVRIEEDRDLKSARQKVKDKHGL